MAARPAPVPPPKRVSVWETLLYRSYYRSAGLNFFIVRRLRPAGIAIVLVLILSSVLGVGHHRRDPVFQIFSLCMGMTLIALPWAFFRRASLEAVREIPRYATVGEAMRYTLRVRNVGRRRVRGIAVSETPPDPRPQLAEFLHAREPGEHERNWFDRQLAYFRWRWLLSKRRLFDGGSSINLIDLESGASGQLQLELTPVRRGVIRLDDLRVLLPDPFGLFQRARKVSAQAATLTVLPLRYRLPPFDLPGRARFQIGGESVSNSTGNAGEFVGLRDYRPGDSLRQIHWKSWARTGRPIVKELEDIHYPRYGLVLDTFAAAGASELFEEAVSVAASFAATIDTRESLLDLMFIKDEAHVVTAGRGIARAEKLLEVLAAVEPEPQPDLETLARLVLRHREELTSCLVILIGWDEQRAEFFGKLRGGGIVCAPIIIGIGPPPTGISGHWLESGHIARDLCRLPSRFPERG
jgi:uncharacterized protein (DUF58 family)